LDPEQRVFFPPFCLDIAQERLWRGAQALSLRPKTFAVLRYLATRPNQLVNKEELLRAIWADVCVSPAMPKLCIREIRKALGDDPNKPQFIATIPRRGWRFIAPITTAPPGPDSKFHASNSDAQPSGLSAQNSCLVGREAELVQLHDRLAQAIQGKRQVVFVTGEPGIGKTTLVETFLAPIAAERNVWVAQGQCIEQYGTGEAYMPVLEALERLCHTEGGERLVRLLRQYAPMWLVQMPSLLTPAEREELQRQLVGTTPERMLREMAHAIEALTVEKPLVLVLEDLHWSDSSTGSLVAFLARQPGRTRLLVIGTYRPGEVLAGEHPLKRIKQELQVHGLCGELPLRFLTAGNVAEYLAARFPAGAVESLQRLARAVHQRTEGNPLFMTKVVDYLVGQKLIVQHNGQWELKNEAMAAETPTDILQFLEQQIERVSPEKQQVLEAASVAGIDFSAAAVAAGLEREVDEVEHHCEGLTRRGQFLRSSGAVEWPDGAVSSRYSFVHALYQQVLYERLTAKRRVQLHRKIGEREEKGYRERAGEIAAELAMHFEKGRDDERAVRYLRQAGENAARRYAYQEASAYLTKGLELLHLLPDTLRGKQELGFQATLGSVSLATKGFAAPEVEKAYARARTLCQQVGEAPQLFPVLLGLRLFYNVRGKLHEARELGEQCLRLAQGVQDPVLLLGAHHALGDTVYLMGEFVQARAHQEQAIALYDPKHHHSLAFLWQCYDLGVDTCAHAAWVLWYLGYPEQALQRSQQAITLAQELSHPYSLAHALFCAAWLHQHRRENQAVHKQAEATIALATEHGFAMELAWATILRGWSLTEQGQGEEGITQLRQGLDAWRATGAGTIPYFLVLLAEAYGKTGQVEKGLKVLDEALAVAPQAGRSFCGAELYRFKGELTLQQQLKVESRKSKVPHPQPLAPNTQAETEAEECFVKAIEIARKQQARSLELRAAMSLVRLRQQQAAQHRSRITQRKVRTMLDAARNTLSDIYTWFTEGFDTKDLQEAKALLKAQ
jgi:DNA-binding winged helix-turn-helix (wHTH) protein/tetratricopeptide (TPR) repeat protein